MAALTQVDFPVGEGMPCAFNSSTIPPQLFPSNIEIINHADCGRLFQIDCDCTGFALGITVWDLCGVLPF